VNFGGGAVLHGSVPLTRHWGAHAQLAVMGIHGTSMFSFGVGIGYQ
jgi:hypothetical protein